jgi:hypothetical protein
MSAMPLRRPVSRRYRASRSRKSSRRIVARAREVGDDMWGHGTTSALFRRVSATRENKARTELKENCASM